MGGETAPEGPLIAGAEVGRLTSALARQKGLRVVARTSAFAFMGERLDLREIGRRLNVSHVIFDQSLPTAFED